MKYQLLFILVIVMATLQIQAADVDNENRFYDKSTEHFTAYVGQLASRAGYIRFADAEIPPDPNTPVVRSFDVTAQITDGINNDGTYSYTIEGTDAAMFSAIITSVSTSENGCTVRIIYHPIQAGSHTARLNVYCQTAGSPLTYINLSGEAIPQPGDVDGDGQVGISDVTRLIDMILTGE